MFLAQINWLKTTLFQIIHRYPKTFANDTQVTFACSKPALEKIEMGMKYAQS